jgi:hypothetical protein
MQAIPWRWPDNNPSGGSTTDFWMGAHASAAVPRPDFHVIAVARRPVALTWRAQVLAPEALNSSLAPSMPTAREDRAKRFASAFSANLSKPEPRTRASGAFPLASAAPGGTAGSRLLVAVGAAGTRRVIVEARRRERSARRASSPGGPTYGAGEPVFSGPPQWARLEGTDR